MPTPGRLEAVIKLSQLPEADTTATNWKHFVIEADGLLIEVTMKPKMFRKLEEVNQQAAHGWVGMLTGKIGSPSAQGFTLVDPNLQVFEKKPKADAAPPSA